MSSPLGHLGNTRSDRRAHRTLTRAHLTGHRAARRAWAQHGDTPVPTVAVGTTRITRRLGALASAHAGRLLGCAARRAPRVPSARDVHPCVGQPAGLGVSRRRGGIRRGVGGRVGILFDSTRVVAHHELTRRQQAGADGAGDGGPRRAHHVTPAPRGETFQPTPEAGPGWLASGKRRSRHVAPTVASTPIPRVRSAMRDDACASA